MIVRDRAGRHKAAAQSAKVGNILARVAGRTRHSLAALRTTFKNRSDRWSVFVRELQNGEKYQKKHKQYTDSHVGKTNGQSNL